MSTTMFDAKAEAALARSEHARLVELLMHTIDLVDEVQAGNVRVNVANLRKGAGEMMRRSSDTHTLALAALALDDAPEYADELCTFVETGGDEEAA